MGVSAQSALSESAYVEQSMPRVYLHRMGAASNHPCLPWNDEYSSSPTRASSGLHQLWTNPMHTLLVFHPSHTMSTGKRSASTLASTETHTASKGAMI